MATRTFDLKITGGTSTGPYNVLYNTNNTTVGGILASLTVGGTPASGLSLTSLNTGVNVDVPDTSQFLLLYNTNITCIGNNTYPTYIGTGTTTTTSSTTHAPTTTTTTTVGGTTTTTSSTTGAPARIRISNTSTNIIVGGVTVNSIAITPNVGSFPLSTGNSLTGTSVQVGVLTLIVNITSGTDVGSHINVTGSDGLTQSKLYTTATNYFFYGTTINSTAPVYITLTTAGVTTTTTTVVYPSTRTVSYASFMGGCVHPPLPFFLITNNGVTIDTGNVNSSGSFVANVGDNLSIVYRTASGGIYPCDIAQTNIYNNGGIVASDTQLGAYVTATASYVVTGGLGDISCIMSGIYPLST